MTSRVQHKSTDVRGFRGGLLHAASEGQLSQLDNNLAAGISEERAYDILASQMQMSSERVMSDQGERVVVKASV